MVEQIPRKRRFFRSVDLPVQPSAAVVAVGGAGGVSGELVQGVEGVGHPIRSGAVVGGVVPIGGAAAAGVIEWGQGVDPVIGVGGVGVEALVILSRSVAGNVVAVFQRFEHGQRFGGFR